MIREAIDLLVNKKDLTMEQAAEVMNEIMTGEATPAQLGAFLTALRLKGESSEEIAGMAQVMREKANHVQYPEPLLDIVGTGGDAAGTFNVSTAAAFVAAAAGAKVAKHGNRAISSKSGAADLLEALGVKIELTPEQVASCIAEAGMGFMFAPAFHPAMRFAMPTRREIGIRTVFNVLGPLTNPAGAVYEVCGVADGTLAQRMAQTLERLGAKHVLVVHSDDNLDEISICAPTHVWELRDGKLTDYSITPEQFGFRRAASDTILGGDAQQNAATLKQIFSGGAISPLRDMVTLNAGVGLYTADKAKSIDDGIVQAAEAIVRGDAWRKVEQLAQVSQRFS